MNIRRTIIATSAVLAVAAPLSTLAATAGQEKDPNAQVVTLQYQTGGQTDAARARMDRAAAFQHYDLQVHMPKRPSGSSWRDVQIKVTDAQGLPVVNAPVAGPLFYARLPQGRYTVKVDDGRHSKVIEVKLAPDAPASLDVSLG